MSVAIRLRRLGRKKKPFYRFSVIDSRDRRDGRPIEDLGWFDPHNDQMIFKLDRFDHWIGVGAQPSDRVLALAKRQRASLSATV